MGHDYGGLRITQKANVDRISSLPDDVISLILSLLPTKRAVGTSILSKRWKYLWTSITCLNFKNHTDNLGNYNAVEFTNFVGHVFRSCNPKHIKKLILHFPWFRADESSVITWIDEWIKHEISELDLSVYNFPLRVFSCTTLTVLTIGDCYDYDPEVVWFNLPSLNVLHINGRFNRFMENLISNCLALEDLTLGGSNVWYIADTFMVSAPTLKTLRLQLIQNCIANYSRYITVEAPNLEYLHFSEDFIDYKIKGIFSSLVKAYVNIGNISMGHLFKKPPRRWTLPNFPSLTCLEVVSCDNRFWAMLLKFISRTPSLEVLSLEQGRCYNVRDDGYDLAEPKVVPKCVGHHLGVIKVEGFKGRKHELQLLKYFLGNANVLKTLSVNRQGLEQEEEIKFVGQLQEFSRASKDCKIKFHGNVMLSQAYRLFID